MGVASTVQGSQTDAGPEVVFQTRARQHHVWRYWSWTLFALSVAIALLIAIIIIVVQHDGKPLPEWPLDINLTTLVALLSTVFRASVVVVLADVIGQSKWTWFRNRARPLEDLQKYDEASRGVWGSLQLIGTLKFGFVGENFLALVAAILTILSLAIGPFAQQSVKTRACSQLMDGERASFPIAHTMPGEDGYYRIGAALWELGTGMKGAMIKGLTNVNDSQIPIACSTGNCTFTEPFGVPYSTLGMCSKCMDMTPLVEIGEFDDERSRSSVNVSLGNAEGGNITVNAGNYEDWFAAGAIKLDFAEASIPDEIMEIAGQSLSNISLLTVTQAPCVDEGGCPHTIVEADDRVKYDFVAVTCILYPCMRTFKPQVVRNSLTEEPLDTKPLRINGDLHTGISSEVHRYHAAVKSPCVIGNELYNESNFTLVPNDTDVRAFRDFEMDGRNVSVPTDCFFQVTPPYMFALRRFLEGSLFSGTCQWQGSQANFVNCQDQWWLQALWNKNNATVQTLVRSMTDFTDVVSTYFRTDGYGPLNRTESFLYPGEERPEQRVFGQVHEMSVCVQLDWPWLLMPALLCLITMVLLATMLFTSHSDQRQAVWTSHILPLLFFGIETSEQDNPRPTEDLNDIHDLCAKTLVALRPSEQHTGSAFRVMKREEQNDNYEMASDVDSLMDRDTALPT